MANQLSKATRAKVFDYIYTQADDVNYMSMNASECGKFQDSLVIDENIKKIAGEFLSRKYIKDTVLNRYSKDQRYISIDDIVDTFEDVSSSQITGTDFNNAVFTINASRSTIECTNTSINEWHTAIKRFGSNSKDCKRLIFLSCGGVEKNPTEISEIQKTILSYGLQSVVVKPLIKSYKLAELFPLIKITQRPINEKIVQLPKPFVLLAGISGTGKTRFVRQQANIWNNSNNYCLVSVRPDWHEPSDLLGYISRLSGNAEYVVTDVLKFIVKAWLEIKQTGLVFQENELLGEEIQRQKVQPYWLCLDEMNLAPVEQYFADYLSVLETRMWSWQGDSFTYKSDPILKATIFDTVDQKKLKHELGLDEHNELWEYFVANGIGIPFNLIVAGTVNMDETTHGFSRKVIDRALTFDFGEFFPNDFDAFFYATSEPKALSYPILTDGRNKTELNSTFDKDGALSITFLKQVNVILENTPFKLAYRALNELLLAVITQKPQSDIELQSVWDDFLMCKVLPRIEGDIDKLTKNGSDKSILEQLSTLLSQQFTEIWLIRTRQDLFRKSLKDDSLIQIECRSRTKLEWMNDQLKNGFTSFWP